MALTSIPKAELVIIGASVAGGFLIRKLIRFGTWTKFNTTVIDRNEFVEWLVTMDDYLFDETKVDKHLFRTKDYFEQNQLSKYNIKFVQGTVKNVTSEGYDLGGTVEFESSESEEGIEKCQFDYLVIATGAQYGTPIKDGNRTKANRSQELKCWSSRIADASEVVVVGGGAVGVEFSAGIAYKNRQNKNKERTQKVHLVTRSNHLLERLPPKASQYALDALTKLNVTIHFNKDAEELRSELPDALFLPAATCIDTSFLDRKVFGDSIASNGGIKVNRYMQVESFGRIFALGDCSVTPLNEEKGVVSVAQIGNTVWHNLVNSCENRSLVSLPTRIETVQGVTLGRNDGLFVVNYQLVMTGRVIPKFKDKTGEMFGNLQHELAHDKQSAVVLPVLGWISAFCGFCPISSRYRETALIKKGVLMRKDESSITERIDPKKD